MRGWHAWHAAVRGWEEEEGGRREAGAYEVAASCTMSAMPSTLPSRQRNMIIMSPLTFDGWRYQWRKPKRVHSHESSRPSEVSRYAGGQIGP